MISRGRARWAKTERAQWSRDHQTNNTVPTQNGASCCAPFFFFCRFCRFCFFFFVDTSSPIVVGHRGVLRSRPPTHRPDFLAAFRPRNVSNTIHHGWIPRRFPTAREIHLCGPSMIHRYDDRGWRRWTRGCSIVYRSDPWKSEFIGR